MQLRSRTDLILLLRVERTAVDVTFRQDFVHEVFPIVFTELCVAGCGVDHLPFLRVLVEEVRDEVFIGSI